LMGREDAKKALEKQLVIVNDDLFRHITDYATPLNAHIQLKNETKASDNLWYEETLPPDTLLYVTLVAQPVYLNEALQTANNLMGWTQQLFSAEHAYLQLGGNETVGMGWCKVTLQISTKEFK
ncbi:MAG: RAMP superfamily CRISPR-associated protein, partial [Candidatus Parabeggiatoa sp.]|nr:RAMP superfamily CRISPR-associated protein [Candidatus Parabeggiatoa sp.]